MLNMVLSYRSSFSLKWRKLFNQNSLRYLKRELSFQDLGINIRLTRVLRGKGIRNPSDIQEKAIQSLLAGDSAVINSETGSGKTLAYALPIVNNVQAIKRRGLNIPCPYGLIVVPNTELQHQVSGVFKQLGANVCGANEDSPLRLLNTDVVVSTPMFLMTYHLDVFKQVQTVVFDEADIMIAKKVGKHGYKDPLFNLIKQLIEPSHFQCFNNGDNCSHNIDNQYDGDNRYDGDNNNQYDGDNILSDENTNIVFKDNRQFVFVGATMPDNEARRSKVAMHYIRSWVPDINMIQSENVHKVVTNIDMVYKNVLDGNKFKLLVQTLKSFSEHHRLRVIVFVNKYETATSLHHLLTKFNYDMSDHLPDDDGDVNFLVDLRRFHMDWEGKIHILHKNVNINDRIETFHRFSTSERSMVVTTDVASRGLDFPDIDIVIQYDFATNVIDVLHRSGRTGRMGKQGKVVNFITGNDEILSDLLQEATKSGESLENLFSRRRGLQRKRKRAEKEKESMVEKHENIEEETVLV